MSLSFHQGCLPRKQNIQRKPMGKVKPKHSFPLRGHRHKDESRRHCFPLSIAPGCHFRGFLSQFLIPFVQETKLLRAEMCHQYWHTPERTVEKVTNKMMKSWKFCTICLNMSFIKTSLKSKVFRFEFV